MTATTNKHLHVSPFLDEAFRYDIRLRGSIGQIELDIDVVPDGGDEPTLETAMSVERSDATRASLGATSGRSWTKAFTISKSAR